VTDGARRAIPAPPGHIEFAESEVEQSIVARFWKGVLAHPEALAVQTPDDTWTYRSLASAAGALARRLTDELGPGAGTVALLLPQGASQIVAILGVLQAGKTFVPLEPSDPPDRIGWMIADCRARLVLRPADVADRSPSASPRAEPPGALPPPDDIARIIYTSGSTGRPKGVLQTHRNLLQYVRNYTNGVRICPADRLSLLYSPGFAAAHLDTFAALLNGASVHAYDVRVEGWLGLEDWLERSGLTVLHCAPTVFRRLVESLRRDDALRAVRVATLGGEPVLARDVEAVHRRFPRGCRLINHLGATEMSIIAQFVVDPESPPTDDIVPVGYPVDGVDITLLDESGHEVAPGETGEMVVCSRYLSPGYLGQPDLVARAFGTDPRGDGWRSYRTGDIGRWRPDGALEHRGRRQHRLKIRGHTVEVAEIEAALFTVPGVREAAVFAGQESSDAAPLVAYWVHDGNAPRPTPRTLSEALARVLPGHMIPSSLVELALLPLTPGGKVDRLALPPCEAPPARSPDGFVAPRTPDEERMARLWTEVLSVSPIGVHDHFLYLGGHSLLAATLLVQVRDEFGVGLPLRALFENPTVESLCRHLQSGSPRGQSAPSLRRVSREHPHPLSCSQAATWRDRDSEVGRLGYNSSMAFEIRGPLDPRALQGAFLEVVRRHEALRTVIRVTDGEAVQTVTRDRIFELPLLDCRGADSAEAALSAAREEVSRPFDLSRDLLVRAKLLRLGPLEHHLLLTLHHLAFDAFALRLFLEELGACYGTLRHGRAPSLPEPRYQYVDYAAWEREWLGKGGPVYRRCLEYWLRELTPPSPTLRLPFRRSRPATRDVRGAFQRFEIGLDVVTRLGRLCREQNVTPFMATLGAFLIALHHATHREDLTLGIYASTRNLPGLDRTMGFFANLVAYRADLSGDPSFAELLRRTRERTLDVTAHQELPFSELAEELSRRGVVPPDISVNFQHVDLERPALQLDDLDVEPHELPDERIPWGFSLTLSRLGAKLRGDVALNTDLYDPDGAVGFVGRYRDLLRTAVADPSRRLSALER
jgi:amino acid adenylation domain-containing protein